MRLFALSAVVLLIGMPADAQISPPGSADAPNPPVQDRSCLPPAPGTPEYGEWLLHSDRWPKPPPGFHFDPDTCAVLPNDPCMRSELVSTGAIQNLNATRGRPNGVPFQVASVKEPASVDLVALSVANIRFRGDAITCHETLVSVSGTEEGGVVSFFDPGQYAPIQVSWLSDSAIAHALADVDRLETASNLYVKPDLATPAIQQCVGKRLALGGGEQFPGQLWAACSAGLGGATR